MYNLKFHEVMGFLLGSDATDERLGVCYPSLDVYENDQELCIEVEIPGVVPDDVDVDVVGRLLRISGKKKDPLQNKGVRFVRMERSFGSFIRELEIPERFDLDKITARSDEGVLVIRVARAEAQAEVVKRIEIE